MGTGRTTAAMVDREAPAERLLVAPVPRAGSLSGNDLLLCARVKDVDRIAARQVQTVTCAGRSGRRDLFAPIRRRAHARRPSSSWSRGARSPTDLGLLRTRLRGRSARRSLTPAWSMSERLCRHRGPPRQTTRQSSHRSLPERSSRRQRGTIGFDREHSRGATGGGDRYRHDWDRALDEARARLALTTSGVARAMVLSGRTTATPSSCAWATPMFEPASRQPRLRDAQARERTEPARLLGGDTADQRCTGPTTEVRPRASCGGADSVVPVLRLAAAAEPESGSQGPSGSAVMD